MVLPVDPAPGFGGLLLGAIVAAHLDGVHEDHIADVRRLIDEIGSGQRIVQPRLRHRFQVDRHGLGHSTHRLVGDGDDITFDFNTTGTGLVQVLGAVYAAAVLVMTPVAETAEQPLVRLTEPAADLHRQLQDALTALYDVIRVDAFDPDGIKKLARCARGKRQVVERPPVTG